MTMDVFNKDMSNLPKDKSFQKEVYYHRRVLAASQAQTPGRGLELR
jgi:hypothetical protein